MMGRTAEAVNHFLLDEHTPFTSPANTLTVDELELVYDVYVATISRTCVPTRILDAAAAAFSDAIQDNPIATTELEERYRERYAANSPSATASNPLN